MSHDIERPEPDVRLTADQVRLTASLSDAFIRQVDEALLASATHAWSKVVRLVGLTMLRPELRVRGLPDVYYAMRVRRLVEAGHLEANGNLDYMRYSEVRLRVPLSPET